MMIQGTDLVQKAAAPVGPERPSLVLFGRSATGRPRAAWFSAADADAAILSAGATRLRTQSLDEEAQREIGGQFARGRILPSGKAFVPFARRELYGRFVALVGDNFGFTGADTATGRKNGASEPKAGAELANTTKVETSPTTAGAGEADGALARGNGAKPDSANEPAKPRPGDSTFIGEPLPRSPEQIGLGSVVLAHEGADEGWWEAEVIAFNGRVFSLRWRDYQTEPTIVRKAGELALLPSGEA